MPDGLGVDVFLYVFSPTHTATVGRCANWNDYLIDSMNKTGYFFFLSALHHQKCREVLFLLQLVPFSSKSIIMIKTEEVNLKMLPTGKVRHPYDYIQYTFQRWGLSWLCLQKAGPQLHSLFSELVRTVQPTDSNECWLWPFKK